jgi:ankyrin repeat protein
MQEIFDAAANGDEEVVRRLVAQADVDPNSEDKDGQTPLSLAAKSGHAAVVRLLLARDGVKADSNHTPSWLRSLRLHKYTDNLKDLEWTELVELDDKSLIDRGVNALGARNKRLKVSLLT